MLGAKWTVVTYVFLSTTLVWADGGKDAFFQVIGPDGLIMNIPASVAKNTNVAAAPLTIDKAVISPKSDTASSTAIQKKPVASSSSQSQTLQKQSTRTLPAQTQVINAQSTVISPIKNPSTANKLVNAAIADHTHDAAGSIIQNANKQDQTDSGLTMPASALADISNPKTYKYAGTSYTDSDVLEQAGFNTDNKKRFYEIPIDHGVPLLVEQKAQLNVQPLFQKYTIFSQLLSPQYQVLSATQTQQILGVNQIDVSNKRLNVLNEEMRLWLTDVNQQKTIIGLDQRYPNIELRSYASSINVETFYWPFVYFTDAKGTVVGAVEHYFKQYVGASWNHHAYLQGYFVAPKGAQLMVLTPVSQSQDVSSYQLSPVGQVTLIPQSGQ